MRTKTNHAQRALIHTLRYAYMHPEKFEKIVPGRVALKKRVEHIRKGVEIITNDKYLARIITNPNAEYADVITAITRYALKKTNHNLNKATLFLKQVLSRFSQLRKLEGTFNLKRYLIEVATKKNLQIAEIEEFVTQTEHMLNNICITAPHQLKAAIKEIEKQHN